MLKAFNNFDDTWMASNFVEHSDLAHHDFVYCHISFA